MHRIYLEVLLVADYSWLVDLDMSPEGDLEIDEHGDFALAHGPSCLEDDIHIRVSTNNPDFYHYPEIGATLDDLKGQPNTREVANIGVEKIRHCLTRDGKIASHDLTIYAAPTSPEELMFYIIVKSRSQRDMVIPYAFKLQ